MNRLRRLPEDAWYGLDDVERAWFKLIGFSIMLLVNAGGFLADLLGSRDWATVVYGAGALCGALAVFSLSMQFFAPFEWPASARKARSLPALDLDLLEALLTLVISMDFVCARELEDVWHDTLEQPPDYKRSRGKRRDKRLQEALRRLYYAGLVNDRRARRLESEWRYSAAEDAAVLLESERSRRERVAALGPRSRQSGLST